MQTHCMHTVSTKTLLLAAVCQLMCRNTFNGPDPGPAANPIITAGYIFSSPIVLTGTGNITLRGKAIAGGHSPAITLIRCHDIHILSNILFNSTDVGIHLIWCRNITIEHNFFTRVSTGVYAEQTTGGGIVVDSNQFLNMLGPFPRGQFVQFNNVGGSGCSISGNRGENIFGLSYPEDAISLYQSHGADTSPILIKGNWIRGGGPSRSGGGIMLGDNGGSWLAASDNILVDPGEYGMAIAGGDHNSIIRNKIYGRSQPFTNVGLYVNSINGYTVTNAVVSDNQVNFFNASNYNNNAWLAPGVEKPMGWDENSWGAAIDSTLLPARIISNR